jgi:hypothetical protein
MTLNREELTPLQRGWGAKQQEENSLREVGQYLKNFRNIETRKN